MPPLINIDISLINSDISLINIDLSLNYTQNSILIIRVSLSIDNGVPRSGMLLYLHLILK